MRIAIQRPRKTVFKVAKRIEAKEISFITITLDKKRKADLQEIKIPVDKKVFLDMLSPHATFKFGIFLEYILTELFF